MVKEPTETILDGMQDFTEVWKQGLGCITGQLYNMEEVAVFKDALTKF
jgi:hypothetical protein